MYRLSARQRKEIGRGHRLHIAMPHPPGPEIDDPLAWARAHLDAGEARIVDARVEMVPVNPRLRPDTGIAHEIGSIVSGDPADLPVPILHVECVIAVLVGRRQSRGNYPYQWPLEWRP